MLTFMQKFLPADWKALWPNFMIKQGLSNLALPVKTTSHNLLRTTDFIPLQYSLDAMKVINHSEWNYLWALLDHLCFSSNFLDMIKILYANPSATILSGQVYSQSFTTGRGTRQGCPLSSLLFGISLEPLAQAVH